MECAKVARRNSDESHKAKRIKLNDDEGMIDDIKLDNLPDDVLYVLLTYLDSTAIYNLTRVLNRINLICKSDCYWKKIDARRKPISLDMISYCLNCVNEYTTEIRLAGNRRIDEIFKLPESIKIRECNNLRVLALENQTINGEEVTLNDLPEALEELSLRRSFVISSRKFFSHTCSSRIKLKVLVLDQCKWFTAEHLLSISRYKDLEVLSLYLCKNLTDEISYTSICFRFGFKSLKILNLRFIGMGDQVLKSIYNHSTLQELYFQSYSESYIKSCEKRKLNILNGERTEDVTYLSDDDVTLDVMLNKSFPEIRTCATKMEIVTPNGVSSFRSSRPNTNGEKYAPNFVLYKNQYDECKCGFYERYLDITEDLRKPSLPSKEHFEPSTDSLKDTPRFDDLIIDHFPIMMNNGDCFTRDERLLVMSTEEELLKESTPDDHCHLWMYFRKPINDYEISMYESVPRSVHKHLKMHGEDVKKRSIDIKKTENTNGDAGPSSSNDQSNDDTENSSATTPPPLIGTVIIDSFRLSGRLSENRGSIHYPCRILAPPLPQVEQHMWYVNRAVVHRDIRKIYTTNIKRLSLRGYKTVDDNCLNSINHIKLNLLDVHDTNVTNAGLYNFMINNPQCRVVHENACICEPRMHF